MTTCTSRAARAHLLRRPPFFIGLFVGPFIFVAALTGTLYVATPQLENLMYRQALQGEMSGERHSLAEQIAVAERSLGTPLRLSAVRPALEAGETTRVMFDDPALAPSENRAIFIDPITLAIKGKPCHLYRSRHVGGERRYDGLRYQWGITAAPVDRLCAPLAAAG